MSNEYKENGMYSELLRYIDNSMPEDEHQKFKDSLKDDCFLKDAVDGLSLLKSDEIERDFKSLRFKKSGTKTFKNIIVVLLGLVLVGIVVFLLFLNNKDSDDSDIDSELNTSIYEQRELFVEPDSIKDDTTEISVEIDSVQAEFEQNAVDSISRKTKSDNKTVQQKKVIPVKKLKTDDDKKLVSKHIPAEADETEKSSKSIMSGGDDSLSIHPLLNEVDFRSINVRSDREQLMSIKKDTISGDDQSKNE